MRRRSMKNEFLTGMAALLLTFGLVLAGCPQDSSDDPGGNTPETPDTIRVGAVTIGPDDGETSDWGKAVSAAANGGRYVILDLSDCRFTNDTVVSSQNGTTGIRLVGRYSRIIGIILPASVTSIGNGAFSGCRALTSVTIPAGVTSIGQSAFYGCDALTTVTIPAGVTSIEYNTFYGCAALTSVTIPGTVTSIGSGAFQGCAALTGVTIPAGVTSIGNYAFSGCTALTSVTIPAGVTSIGNWAFEGCAALTSVTFAEDSAIDDGDFDYSAFPEGADGSGGNTLRTAYLGEGGGAGTYTRDPDGSTWTKQGA
jgi:hypothetical protein